MSTKVEYICDACGKECLNNWIEFRMFLLNGGVERKYHSCDNTMCMNKVQQKQCNDFATWSNIKNRTGI